MSASRSTTAADVEALKAATREAHEALADLRAERRRLAEDRRAVQALVDDIGPRTKAAFDEHMASAVRDGLAEWAGKIREFTGESHDRVIAAFDELVATCMGLDGDVPLYEQLRAQILARRLGSAAGRPDGP